MKFIHLTDPHLTTSGELYGIDVVKRLRSAVASINKHHADANLCIVTGDLAHWSEPEAYDTLRDILASLTMPWHPLIGNHDDRARLFEHLPGCPADENGFVQYTLDVPAGRFMVLDTVDSGKDVGVLCSSRLAWLDARLTETPSDTDVYLFGHHAPMVSGIGALDQIMLSNARELGDLLAKHACVRHFFFGHMHRACHGSWRGIPFSTLKSTAHQVEPIIDASPSLTFCTEEPAYAVVLLSSNAVVIHDISYMEEDKSIFCTSDMDRACDGKST